jgi:hypothetical protein
VSAAYQLELVAMPAPEPTPAERFAAFDAANPEVWRLFERFALAAVHAGRERIGAKLIVERIRWHVSIETTGDDFKINNNYTAYYARRFQAAHPEHANLFQTRGEP